MKKPVKKSKSKTPQPITAIDRYRQRAGKDMQLFYRQLDQSAMWEDWFLGVNPDGTAKYLRLWEFVKTWGETEEQRDFLLWYLGPKSENWKQEPEAALYPFVKSGPVDWIARKNGGWYAECSAEEFSKEIARRTDALEKLMETVGYSKVFLVRAVQLDEKLDREFKQSFIIPGMSKSAIEDRARLYLELKGKLLEYYEKAHDRYAKSLGINFEDMAGLIELMNATAVKAAQATQLGEAVSPAGKALNAMLEMTLAKAGRYKIPLPSDAEEKIIDAVAEHVPAKSGKKTVQ
ncbi:MAG: hypothetical protein KGL39_39425 [Patescibacteria group bacterium]|nr:hypothetical protein [Patescibacteria group bacterium]